MRYDSKLKLWIIDLESNGQAYQRLSTQANNAYQGQDGDKSAQDNSSRKQSQNHGDSRDGTEQKLSARSGQDNDQKSIISSNMGSDAINSVIGIPSDQEGNSRGGEDQGLTAPKFLQQQTQFQMMPQNLILDKTKSLQNATFKDIWESRYIQLMILMAAGEVRSCKFNAYVFHEKL